MIKHVGKHRNKKVVLVFRKVPGEDHMCLVTYSDDLPNLYHDNVMRLLESPAGQQAESFSDVLFRNFMPDGRNCLDVLHRDGYIKKVATDQIIITPNKNSSVVLTELNQLLDEMSKGNEAIKRLGELDAEQAKAKKTTKAKPLAERSVDPMSPDAIADVLSDKDLAMQRIKQAKAMQADAERLLKEAELLMQEAADLDPTVKANDNNTKKKPSVKAKKT